MYSVKNTLLFCIIITLFNCALYSQDSLEEKKVLEVESSILDSSSSTNTKIDLLPSVPSVPSDSSGNISPSTLSDSLTADSVLIVEKRRLLKDFSKDKFIKKVKEIKLKDLKEYIKNPKNRKTVIGLGIVTSVPIIYLFTRDKKVQKSKIGTPPEWPVY